MDTLDVKILRRLTQSTPSFTIDPDFRRSFRSIAKHLGVDEATVRNRIRKFQASGFIPGWRVFVNPRILGGGWIATWFDLNDTKSKGDVVESLRLLEGALIVAVSYGTWIGIVLGYLDEASLPRKIELVRRIAGVDRVVVQRVPFPDCKILLTQTDRAILQALQGRPRKSYELLSKEVGLSSRTLKGKVDRMMKAGAVFASPTLDAKKLSGSVMAFLHVSYLSEDKEEVDRRILAKLDDYIWHVFQMMPLRAGEFHFCAFNLLLPNVSKAEEILKWTAIVPKVLSARIDLCADIITIDETPEAPRTRS